MYYREWGSTISPINGDFARKQAVSDKTAIITGGVC